MEKKAFENTNKKMKLQIFFKPQKNSKNSLKHEKKLSKGLIFE